MALDNSEEKPSHVAYIRKISLLKLGNALNGNMDGEFSQLLDSSRGYLSGIELALTKCSLEAEKYTRMETGVRRTYLALTPLFALVE